MPRARGLITQGAVELATPLMLEVARVVAVLAMVVVAARWQVSGTCVCMKLRWQRTLTGERMCVHEVVVAAH